MARQIFAAEISHDDAPLHIREKLASSESTIKEHLMSLSPLVEEVCILSSSNRFAMYVVHDDIAPVTNFFNQYPILKGYTQYYYNTEESITHLFATASGLLSEVKGEHQILTHLKQAHQWAVEAGTLGITLDNLLQQALRIGKKVRTQTGIDKFGCSIVEAGIEMLYNRVDDLHNKNFLVIGTGKVSRMVLEYLYNEGIQNVCLAGHDIKRTKQIADQFYAEAIPIEKVREQFGKADVIVGGTYQELPFFSGTSDGSVAFSWDFFSREKTRFILDFGMPRNFSSKVADHPSVELYNLDDLKRMYKSPLDAFGGLEDAWTIVMQEAKSFMNVLWQLEVSQILVAYWNRLLDIKQRGMKMLPAQAGQVTAQEVQLLKRYAQRITRSITGVGKKNLKSLTNNFQAENGKVNVESFVHLSDMKLNFSVN
jgi:glutamyl-tRNA reductase